jgi:phospholipase/lecithinase/hemolysin
MRGTLRKLVIVVAMVVAVLAVTVGASAQSFSSMVVFGDSLSDTGNLFDFTDGTIPASPPYFEGRFSNGPVWVEYLASRMGLTPDLVVNFAMGGATTGHTNITVPEAPGLLAQIETFAASGGPADPEALYVVWAGANDFLEDASDPEATITTAVDNIATAVSTLATLGAHTVVVPNLPALGRTPDARESGDPLLIAGATLLSIAFNRTLAPTLDRLEATLGIDLIALDVFALFRAVIADPAAVGLTNVTDRCLSADLTTVCDTPEQYLFWDGRHPTTAAHAILADAAFAAVVPACDANGDGTVDLRDARDLLGVLFKGGGPDSLPGNPDCNEDGEVNFRDVMAIVIDART